MYQAIIIIHILLGLSIIGLILMQQGKGADAGATFGGGASGSVFGAQGAASFLSRTTAILATLFFVTSLGLAWINGNRGVASDLMSAPAAEKAVPETGLPNVDGGNTIPPQAVPAPVPVPAQNTGEKEAAVTPEAAEKPVVAAEPGAPSAEAAAKPSEQPPQTQAVPKEAEQAVEEKKAESKPEKPAKAPEHHSKSAKKKK